MNRRQNVFALVTGALLGIVGSFLATNAIADWSLASVGLGLIALAGIQSLQQASRKTRDTNHGTASASLQPIQALR